MTTRSDDPSANSETPKIGPRDESRSGRWRNPALQLGKLQHQNQQQQQQQQHIYRHIHIVGSFRSIYSWFEAGIQNTENCLPRTLSFRVENELFSLSRSRSLLLLPFLGIGISLRLLLRSIGRLYTTTTSVCGVVHSCSSSLLVAVFFLSSLKNNAAKKLTNDKWFENYQTFYKRQSKLREGYS